jgi:hypothetical protein
MWMFRSRLRLRLLFVFVLLVPIIAAAALYAQGKITTTKEMFGVSAGDDYVLLNYSQLQQYWNKLAQESPRMKLVDIGKTAEGRPMMMAIITSPENHKKLERYREISRRLALAEGLNDEQAQALAQEGKAVVWIDGGLHATECINAQGLFRMAYEMVSRSDAETMRILDNVILLLVPVNPDGLELVSNWYMKDADPKKRNMSIPRLYNKYAGHDNNRDSFAINLPETEAISRQMFIEWIPQVMYNQHQSGPAGTVLFAPPFRDPFNYNHDPLVPMGIELVAANMHNRFIAENKPGAVLRNAAGFSTWFNGGVRTAAGFHNQIGILTEIVGNPTPMSIPLIPSQLLPDTSHPMPIGPRAEWHQSQSIDYIMTANRAILDIAARMREQFLFNIYRMGKNAIEKGGKDTWTLTPKRLAAMQAAIAKDLPPRQSAGGAAGDENYFGFAQPIPTKYYDMLRKPEDRDPRGYIIPSDQPDFITATRFVSTLIKGGITVHRATSAFQVAGKNYPAGSYLIKTAQAFRPHLVDMFEPQDHPNDIPYPGGPPNRPYDITGWTLAFQMGVKFDRILDAFDGPFEKLPMEPIKIGAAKAATAKTVAGYLLSHQLNDSFTATNKLLAAKEDVYWLKSEYQAGSRTWPVGTIYVPFKPTTKAAAEKIAAETGVTFEAAPVKPTGDALKLRPMRVALWDQYGGSMPSGWVRWMLENPFPTTFEVVYPPTLDAGNLNAKYDVIIFPAGAIPESDRASGRGGRAIDPTTVPADFQKMLGSVTVGKTVPQLKAFVENGGTIIAIGSSTSIAGHLGLPIADALVEQLPDGGTRRLSSDKFFVPGSVLTAAVDTANPLAYGVTNPVDVFYQSSPVFRLLPEASLKGVKPVSWFPNAEPLHSGWAWGQGYLKGAVLAAEASVGKGRLFLFGSEITFRAQPHATFKFLFNGIYYGGAQPVSLGAAGKKATN